MTGVEVIGDLFRGDFGSAAANTALAVLPIAGGWMDDLGGLRYAPDDLPNVANDVSVRLSDGIDTAHYGGHGTYAGRPFDPDQAGGPIRELNYDQVRITENGVMVVERHLSRFDHSAANEAMLMRLRQIANGEIPATEADLRFYTHELREFVRYRNLGYPTGEPADLDAAYELWNDTHTATLADYGLRDFEGPDRTRPMLYHEDTWHLD